MFHPYLANNGHHRLYIAPRAIEDDNLKFSSFYRMTKSSYFHLLDLLKPLMQKRDTNMSECVSAEERILITLRYLATGDTFASLGQHFAKGECTIEAIVEETTKVIWTALRDFYLPLPDVKRFHSIAQRFETIWNLPNCIGAIHGKHIRIEEFPRTGSADGNDENYDSAVLMACCDADGLFTMIETGYSGRDGDDFLFHSSALRNWLKNSSNIPRPRKLPDDENSFLFPYFFVGDETFPLSKSLMRPFSKRVLDNVKRIYNYRLGRGLQTIECAFGTMTQKFQVLNNPIRCSERGKVDDIIKAVCVLHNYIRKREGVSLASPQPEQNGNRLRSKAANVPLPCALTIDAQSNANSLRNYLANYFITPKASLPCQWKYCL